MGAELKRMMAEIPGKRTEYDELKGQLLHARQCFVDKAQIVRCCSKWQERGERRYLDTTSQLLTIIDSIFLHLGSE
jgi:hypothetical protein